MLIKLRHGHGAADREALLALAGELGYEVSYLDRERVVVELRLRPDAVQGGRPPDRSRFEDLACVQAVLEAGDAPELFDRGRRGRETVVRVGEAAFGGGSFALIAGPCAVESEGRLFEIARAVRDSGASLLRGGAFKPRTSPYSFRGLGEAGLAMLARVRDEVGLGIVTEVLDPRDVPRVAAVADVLQIGSRSMSNAALLEEAGASGLPVLLKRGMAATTRELLLAAEYVLNAGNERVILCERGIRGFDPSTRNVLDVGAVAHLKRTTHLPVVVDPSHAAGRPELVGPLALAGVAAGADGLIVEVHPAPAETRSDAAQAVSPADFHEIARRARALARTEGKDSPGPREVPGPGEPEPLHRTESR